jgi:pimeloyl-ACP methyl ester carboxylesterase
MKVEATFFPAACALAFIALTGCSLDRQEGRTGVTSAHVRGERITVYTYRPEGCTDPAIMLIFSGASRNARAARDNAIRFSDQYCLALYAPLLKKKSFPIWSYQEGGLVRRGQARARENWTVWIATDLASWARGREGRDNAPYYLFGHSAGGQFLSRVAAFGLPDDAERIIIANPSTYVVPTLEEDVPYGFGGMLSHPQGVSQLRQYLRMPVTILLGEGDVGSKQLVKSEVARRQGVHRYDRGMRIYNFARQIASERRWEFCWRLVTVQNVAHSAADLLESKEAVDAFGFGHPAKRGDECEVPLEMS